VDADIELTFIETKPVAATRNFSWPFCFSLVGYKRD
jgi:hypothetical protein